MRIQRALLAALLFACACTAGAANPGTLLVLNKSDNTVSLVDLAAKKSIATIPTGNGPHEVAVSPDGRIAVVCNYGAQPGSGDTLTVIDVAARKSLRTIDLPKYSRPHGAAWLRGNEMAVTTEGTRKLRLSMSKPARSRPRSTPIRTARTWSRSRRRTIARSSRTSAPAPSR